jgi:nucleoside-diphosphate-sugar epimerase
MPPMRLAGRPSVDAFTGVTCVVTGGLGFIGSNLVHHLVQNGAHVRIVDALVDGHGGDIRNLDGADASHLDVVIAEIGDECVAPLLEGADVVFNLAGQVSHTASMVDPERDLYLNAVTHARFLEMLRRVNPDARVVHASTRQVYGRAIRFPVDEEHPARPVDVNGVAKLAGEQLHLVYAHAHRMAITSLRLTNVYGPRQRLSSNELGFLPVFIRKAMLGETIELFGSGEQRRDCLFVDDVVDALISCAGDRGVGNVYNVGHDRHHALTDLAWMAARLAAAGSEVKSIEWPEQHARIDIGSFESDSSAIESEVGWAATTEIEEGLRQTLDFYREHAWYLSSI